MALVFERICNYLYVIRLFMQRIYIFLFIICLFISHPSDADPQADPGVFKGKIVFGQTAALQGPASALGQGVNDGIQAAFHEVNHEGGVKGRKLELIALDDGYEPEKAITNTNVLITEKEVFALIGGVGTPTANAIQPVTSSNKVPFIGPFTGAEFLRSPYKRYVVNIRGSYWQETEEWVERLTTDLGVKRIAILYQDDSYGRAGLSGVKKALDKRGLTLVGEGTYKRNTTAVKSAILKIRKSNPEAVVMVGAYKPCAAFIKLAKKLNLAEYYVNISFVGSDALAQELGEDGEGVIISQVVPFPYGDGLSRIVANYQSALKAYNPDLDFGFVSLEGYMIGRFVIEVLKQSPDGLTRENFLDTLYNLKDIHIDDLKLSYGPEDNQGMDQVFMTVLHKDGSFTSVDTLTKE